MEIYCVFYHFMAFLEVGKLLESVGFNQVKSEELEVKNIPIRKLNLVTSI